MLRNDAQGVNRIIENIGAQEGIDSVRIYNKGGRVRTRRARGGGNGQVDISPRSASPATRAPSPARASSARTACGSSGPRRRARAGGHHPDLQRARVHHRLPRAPGLPARARDPRRAALDGPGRRVLRGLRAPDDLGLVVTVRRGAAARLPAALADGAPPRARLHRGHGAAGRGRPLRARPGRLLRRDGGDGRVLEPDDGRAASARAASSRAGTARWSSGWRRRRASWSAPTSR